MDEILYQSQLVAEYYGHYRASMIRAHWSKADARRFKDVPDVCAPLRHMVTLHARFARNAHRDYLLAVKQLRRVIADQPKDESHVQAQA